MYNIINPPLDSIIVTKKNYTLPRFIHCSESRRLYSTVETIKRTIFLLTKCRSSSAILLNIMSKLVFLYPVSVLIFSKLISSQRFDSFLCSQFFFFCFYVNSEKNYMNSRVTFENQISKKKKKTFTLYEKL